MGRIATAAIITLALAGATVQSFAGEPPAADKGAPQAAVPADQLLADATGPAPAVGGAPDADQPPPPAPPGGPMMGHMPPPGPMGWGPRPGPGMWHQFRHMEQTWGLFFNQKDKNLSAADVQTLAQAVLLIHGNHAWKVADVSSAADGSITFAYTTADGSVIARFSVDPHSGRMTRIG